VLEENLCPKVSGLLEVAC